MIPRIRAIVTIPMTIQPSVGIFLNQPSFVGDAGTTLLEER
jgi:hypothetical protein